MMNSGSGNRKDKKEQKPSKLATKASLANLREEQLALKRKYANVSRKSTIEEEEGREEFEVVEKAEETRGKRVARREKDDEQMERMVKDATKDLTAVEMDLLKKIEKLEFENTALKKKVHELQDVVKRVALRDDVQSDKEKEKDKEIIVSGSSVSPGSSCTNPYETEENRRLARELLLIMKKNQILDTCITAKDTNVLYNFFRDCVPPSEKVLQVLDNALNKALFIAMTHSERLEDIIENDMRVFMCNQELAKKMLVTTLFQNPELVPDSWGGGADLIRTRKEKLAQRGEEKEEPKCCSPPKSAPKLSTARMTLRATSPAVDNRDKAAPSREDLSVYLGIESPWTKLAERVINEVAKEKNRRGKSNFQGPLGEVGLGFFSLLIVVRNLQGKTTSASETKKVTNE